VAGSKWDVYDALRTARLNQYYFTELLDRVSKKNKRVEITLAIVAPGSAVAGLALWDTGVGKWIWGAIALVAGVIAAAKPFLGYAGKSEQYQSMATQYRAVGVALDELCSTIHTTGTYGPAEVTAFDAIRKQEKDLNSGAPLEPVDAGRRHRLTDVVNAELPINAFA
jgi:hypothetical protein